MPRRGLPAWSLAGLLLALCGPPTNPFEVRLEGTSSEVGYGGTVLLNCSSNCPEAGAPGGLETSLSKEWVGRGPGWLSVRLHNITEPLSDIFCYFSCFGERKVVTFRVLAYDLPQPRLAISNPNASCNQPVAIECSSAPSRPPGLKLRLHSSRWPPQPWAEGPVCLQLTVGEEDDGAEFACEAQLSVGNRTLRKSSATARLRVTYQPRMDDGSCPPSQNWTEGQDETLRCWARGNPPPRLECAKDGEPFPAGVPRPVTRAHAGTYRCQATNPLGTTVRSVTVWVQWLPERVVLEPVPAVAVGESRNLTCRVVEVAPVGNLTVTLRRGAETLRTENFGAAEGSASVAVSHLLTVGPGDHGQDVTCHAELSLRPHGPLFARAAVPVKLSVFALPEPPQLRAPARLEAGTTANASCRIAGAFPAGDVRFTITLAEQSLNFTVTAAGDVLTAVTALSPSTPGRQELTCTAAVATTARTARRQLHIYRFPAPVLELSPASVPAGSEVTVACRAGVADPPAVRLQLRDADGGVLAEGPQSRLELRLVARREDDGRQFGCRASLAIGDGTVTKDTDARLAVLYMPEMAASDCPSNRTWLRGTREALSCRAAGNPAPTVVCGRNGVTVGTGEPELVTRSRAGTYLCNATNSLGTRSRVVTVRVEYEPTLTERGCPAHHTWVEGERRELACRADGDPPPSTRCARDGGAPRTRGSRAVSRADAGRYVCRATNKHGSAVRSVVVTVEYEPSIGETGCPARRLWVEGTPAELACAASGNPPPRVACAKLGDGQDPSPASPNVTRAHAGTYQCRATNTHGSALRNVTVAVEYSPAAVSLRVLPSANVSRGASFSVECRAEGLPTPTYGWALPPAPNLRFAADNRSVAVAAAAAANRGLYTCTATNRHGRRAGSVMVRVDESRLALLASLGSLGAVTAVGLAAAGGYYLKSTACKKGEYNVRDAEGSSEAACLHRQRRDRGEVYGIQLTQP
ncbi:intercellular adhesion molecule 5 [Calonectris borealis]|uniref:intercellular adhesion molecule 5 n=1 Tax=Calonectris borealis TaxID=1323832 RepID=UPI003F4C0146